MFKSISAVMYNFRWVMRLLFIALKLLFSSAKNLCSFSFYLPPQHSFANEFFLLETLLGLCWQNISSTFRSFEYVLDFYNVPFFEEEILKAFEVKILLLLLVDAELFFIVAGKRTILKSELIYSSVTDLIIGTLSNSICWR